MKNIEIIGKNYIGNYNKTRVACRGLVVNDDKILLTYETLEDQWMIPGGGLEGEESEIECCIREISEETGILVKPIECYLEINEYYQDEKYINKYYICEEVGNSARNPTQREIDAGTEPRRIPLKNAIKIFSEYNLFRNNNEMRSGLYYREYFALKEYMNWIQR